MGKIVGSKMWCLLWISFFASLHAEITLQLSDMQGVETQEMYIGEPFSMIVDISDYNDQDHIEIDGMQNFYVKRTGQRLMIVNGQKSMQYIYQVRIDKAGTYVIGPVYYSQSKERSHRLRIKVHESSEKAEGNTSSNVKKPNSKADKKGAVQLQLVADTDNAYVGQKITLMLRCYVPQNEQISVEQIVTQEPTSVTINDKKGPRKELQELDGKSYIMYEWQWNMFAREEGTLVIPAYMLEYAKPLTTDNSFGGLLSFFGPRYEHKRIYSNALTLQIRPLPYTNKEIDAVGNFVSYKAVLNVAAAKQYEGIVFSLSIEGNGNMEEILSPDLYLPEGLKWYASKNYVEDLSNNLQRKTFEYVVQGLKEGDYDIKEQSFSFFDVYKGAYKELKTASLFVTILPGLLQIDSCDDKVHDAEKIVHNNALDGKRLKPLLKTLENRRASKAIPFYWFLFFLALPCLIIGTLSIQHRWRSLLTRLFPHYNKMWLFVDTKNRLNHIKEIGDITLVYGLFIKLFTILYQRNGEYLLLNDIQQCIKQTRLSEEDQQACMIFLSRIMECAYIDGSMQQDNASIFNEATQWIDKLEGAV